MPGKRSSVTLSISAYEKAQLEAIALEFDQTWGEKPNVSKLAKAIAQNKLCLAKNHDWSRDRINILVRTFNLLKDEGFASEALELAYILRSRSELSQPLRQEIQQWVDAPRELWRSQLEDYQRRQRPFRLAYEDAAGRIWSFTVRHIKIQRHEDRFYLDCWCDETERNQDIDALKHNWSMRLDRIPDEAIISPVEGHWQPELAWIEVELHLFDRLAAGYRSKQNADIVVEWLPDRAVRRVVRRIYNTFWFFREVRRYGKDCEIIGPKDVRDRFIDDLKETIQNYE